MNVFPLRGFVMCLTRTWRIWCSGTCSHNHSVHDRSSLIFLDSLPMDQYTLSGQAFVMVFVSVVVMCMPELV